MSRSLRIQYEGAWYHVMNRGAGRKAIFHNDEQRQVFLNLLDEVGTRYHIDIHAYCLMNNHYHLFIHTPLGNLSKALKHLNSTYTQRFNRAEGKDGPLFRGRYKSIIVDAENYLLQLSRYIHLNPTTARLVKKPEDYFWSSYSAYIGNRSKPNWLSCQETLNRFGTQNQPNKYREFVEQGMDEETELFYKKSRKIPIFGSESFQKSILKNHIPDKSFSTDIPERNHLIKKHLPGIEMIMRQVSNFYQVEEKLLLEPRKRAGNKPRSVAIYLAVRISKLSHREIAERFKHISVSGVSQIYRRLEQSIGDHSIIQNEVKQIKKLIELSTA
jgi:putative transposase